MPTEDIPGSRQIEIRSVVILAFVTIVVSVISFFFLYKWTLEEEKTHLVEIVQSQARLMESIGKFNAFFHSGTIEGASRAATLSQIRESHRKYTGFGKTGEIVLAERRGDNIIFLLHTRKAGFNIPDTLDFDDTDLAIPTKQALSGKSGVIEALDHSGEKVIAAYEYLPFLEMGLVAKIDKSEILSPFLKAGLIAGALAFVLIVIGAFLNIKMVRPLISRIYEVTRQIKEREERYSSLVSNIPGVVFQSSITDTDRTMVYMSEQSEELTGFKASNFINNKDRTFASIVHPDDAELFRRATKKYLEIGKSYFLEYRIINANGDEKWVSERGTISEDKDTGKMYLDGVITDISDRKKAEQAMRELPRKLSKYLSPQVYKSIFKAGEDVKIASSRKKLTVFFSDIVGFTPITETMEPEDLSYIINSYLNAMAQIAIEFGGTLDKFVGDGVLIFFGDPETKGTKEDALACVNMAFHMNEAIVGLKREWFEKGIDVPLQIRMGISTGFCTVGNFGSENRMDYTILGRSVNLASRLQSNADPGTILISHETYILVKSDFKCEKREPMHVKGFEHPVQTYQVLELNK